MEVTKKVGELIEGARYQVLGYKPITTKYGETYILKILDIQNNDKFNMFATYIIKKYINENKKYIPNNIGFEILKKRENKVEILGYSNNDNAFVMF